MNLTQCRVLFGCAALCAWLFVVGTSPQIQATPAPTNMLAPDLASATMTIDVWPGLAPGETDFSPGRVVNQTDGVNCLVSDVYRPRLFIYKLNDQRAHPAVLVLPGGGYINLAAVKEGAEIAQWLNGQGFTAAVLYYRVPNNRSGAYQDGQRSLSLLRARAKEFGIDLKRVGVIGFSAGGHLAARLAAADTPRTYKPVDSSDRFGDKPNFTLLIYPAYLTTAHHGTPETAAEVKPHPGMPPTFLVQTQDDPYLDAPTYAHELEAAGVKADLHLYASGCHGYGLHAPLTSPVHAWPDAAAEWLKQFNH